MAWRPQATGVDPSAVFIARARALAQGVPNPSFEEGPKARLIPASSIRACHMTRTRFSRDGSFPPVEIYIQVTDVNAHHDRLKKNKVKITSPLTDQWWGDRTFTVMDPFGYQIWFYQTISEPQPPEGAKIV